jgi:predicted SprT family Zn-dependent metalloprotease
MTQCDLTPQWESESGVLTPTPTEQTYVPLLMAYAHFNRNLFGNSLPDCLITLQRKANTYGYFSAGKFAAIGGDTKADEIAMNPAHFRACTPRDVCSTLVHEMTHVWQQYFGKPPRAGYHDRQWAAVMRRIGLHPSSTGTPGGKQTGYKVTHYVIDSGPFDLAFKAFEATGQTIGWGDAFTRDDEARKRKRDTFVCPQCDQKVLGVPSTDVSCNRCGLVMIARHAVGPVARRDHQEVEKESADQQ